MRTYRVGGVLLAAGSIALLFFAVLLLSAYVFPVKWSLTEKVRGVMPFPAVMIGYHDAVPMNELRDNLLSLKRFYEAQDFSKIGLRVDFSTDEGKKRLKVRERELVNKMVEDAAIRLLAQERGITITGNAAAQEIAKQFSELGEDKPNGVKDRLNRLYGWDLSAFEERAVLPGLYAEALKQSFEGEAGNFAGAKAKIEEARKTLSDRKAFADVAKEFSEGKTAKEGGELGWYLYDDFALELRDAAKNQTIGSPSAIIESSLGFHILLVLERTTRDGKEAARVSQIFVPKQTFPEWLSLKMSKMSVRSLISEYVWNAETARIEFRDSAMRDFEQHLLENSEGDAAFLF
jgi:hypothetical protein